MGFLPNIKVLVVIWSTVCFFRCLPVLTRGLNFLTMTLPEPTTVSIARIRFPAAQRRPKITNGFAVSTRKSALCCFLMHICQSRTQQESQKFPCSFGLSSQAGLNSEETAEAVMQPTNKLAVNTLVSAHSQETCLKISIKMTVAPYVRLHLLAVLETWLQTEAAIDLQWSSRVFSNFQLTDPRTLLEMKLTFYRWYM